MSLYAEDIILSIENPKDSTKKLVELINQFIKVAGYKINVQKSLHFVTLAEAKELGKRAKTNLRLP